MKTEELREEIKLLERKIELLEQCIELQDKLNSYQHPEHPMFIPKYGPIPEVTCWKTTISDCNVKED